MRIMKTTANLDAVFGSVVFENVYDSNQSIN